MITIGSYQDQIQEMKMKKSKTVIIWGQASLHAVGVEAFLNGQTEWEVIRISNQKSTRFLLQMVKKYSPGAVILIQDDCVDNSRLPGMLQAQHPDLRVIRLNLDNNIADVYGMQQVDVKVGADLISLMDIP